MLKNDLDPNELFKAEPDCAVSDTVLVLGHPNMGTGDVEPFDQIFKKGIHCSVADITAGRIDALIIWGGEDISPKLYNEKSSSAVYASDAVLSRRDYVESSLCRAAIDNGVPIIGVCRGAQLLCAMAGGRLIQHVNGHGRSHGITTDDGREMVTSSVHHQMMYPFDVVHDLIAWSTTPRAGGVYVNQNDEMDEYMREHKVEPEIVWFPGIKGLAIQGHPEFMHPQEEFVQYVMELVTKYVVPQIGA